MSGSSPIKILTLSFARRVFTLLVLAAVLTSSLPIPLGWKVVSRTASEPFPCQSCNCGCATPEQCWTACCCFTPEQRRQWAEEHGVIPPAYAVLDRPITLATTKTVSLQCTAKSSACCHCTPAEPETQSQDSRSVLMLSLQAARCRGASTDFTWLPWAIIDSHSENAAPPEAIVRPYRIEDDTISSVILDLESPPPRRS